MTALVAAAWVAMTAQACVFVARYGYNLPRLDEWEFVPVLYGRDDPVGWVASRHSEHRFPLARALYLALHAATGQNFRAGMWVTVTLLSLSAAVLLLAARRCRGRSALPDLLVPVLLLNAGHAENLTMGYQVAFTLTVAFLVLFLAGVAWADRLGPRRAAALCGLATLGVALGGGIGWAFAPWLGLYTAARLPAACRAAGRPLRDGVLLAAAPALAAIYVVASAAELKLSGAARPGNDWPAARAVAFDFWTVALGGAGQFGYPLPGAVVLGCVAEALLLAAASLAVRSPDRRRVAGCAAVVAGVVVLSLAVGVSRPVGNESRYAAFGGLALCAVVLARAAPPRGGRVAPTGVLLVPALAAAVAVLDWRVGTQYAEVHEVRTSMLNRDLSLGLPVNALAERHVLFPVPGYASRFELLAAAGHKSVQDAGPPRPLRAVPLAVPPGACVPAYDGRGAAAALELTLPAPLRMDALRVEFESPEACYCVAWRLDLPGHPDDSAGVASMWVVPGRRTALFRVGRTLDRVLIRAIEPGTAKPVVKVEAVLFE